MSPQIHGTQLADLAAYVNLVAGDPVMVDASAVPTLQHDAHAGHFRARRTDGFAAAAGGSTRIAGRALPGRAAQPHQLGADLHRRSQCGCELEGRGKFTGGKATVSGLTPGTTVWVGVRTAGLKGVMGAWSDPAKIMVV